MASPVSGQPSEHAGSDSERPRGLSTEDGGDEGVPRCPECDYILIGLPGNRCPECGGAFDWEAVLAVARRPRLPIEASRGWGRLRGALGTWLLVLFRPRTFALRLTEKSSTGLATAFAAGCVLIGLGGFLAVFGEGDALQLLLAWPVGIWVHVECQSVLFFLLDLRWSNRLRRWLLWRKVSLYTTAFVALEWVTGPPLLNGYRDAWNFAWILDPDSWHLPRRWWPFASGDLPGLLLTVMYYWWLVVLLVVVGRHLRRKWLLPVVLVVVPVISVAACRIGAEVYQLF